MERISSPLVLALVRMHKDQVLPKLLLDLLIIRLQIQLKNVVRVNKLLVTQQSIKLVLLRVLVVLFRKLLHLKHELLKFLLQRACFAVGFASALDYRLGLLSCSCGLFGDAARVDLLRFSFYFVS
jgi:hypothetical protein